MRLEPLLDALLELRFGDRIKMPGGRDGGDGDIRSQQPQWLDVEPIHGIAFTDQDLERRLDRF